MEQLTPAGASTGDRRAGLRVTAGVVLVILVLLVAMMYHDGMVATQDLSDVREDGLEYRLRATVDRTADAGFVLADAGTELPVEWNFTTPQPGQVYVVVGVYNASSATLVGQAVVRTLVF